MERRMRRTVQLLLEYPDEVDRLIGVVWAATLDAEGRGDDQAAQQLSPIHTRLVELRMEQESG